MGNGNYFKICTLPNSNHNAVDHTMELKVTWLSMCSANKFNLLNEIPKNRVHAIHNAFDSNGKRFKRNFND